jgi:hypothetical protein
MKKKPTGKPKKLVDGSKEQTRPPIIFSAKMAATPPPKSGYTVIRDTREQKGWTFEANQYCEGTIIKGLKTGDYTLVGLEKVFVVERKQSVAEFAKNMLESRFEREMVRLEAFPHAYIVCEFDFFDVQRWPLGSGLPRNATKISKYFIMKRLMDFQVQYKTKFIFVGIHGKEVMSSLFKRITEFYATAATPPKVV